MPSVNIAVQRTTLPTSTGTHDVTVSGFGTPKAAIFTYYRDTGSAGSLNQQDAIVGYGFTDGTNQFSSYADWVPGASDHSGERAQSGSYVAILEETAANNAAFSSWVTDGVRLSVTNGSSLSGCHLDVILISGDDVSAAAGSFAVPGSVGSPRSVTGLSFQPNLVFFTSAGIPNGVNQANSVISWGCAHDNGTSIDQAFVSRGAASNTDNLGWMQRNDGVCGQAYTSNADWRQESTSFNADGLTVTERDHDAGSDDIGYLALSIGSTINAKLTSSYGTPTSTGTDTITTTWTPQFMLGVFGRHTSSSNLSNTNSNYAEVIGNVITDGSQTFYNQTQVDRGNSTTTVNVTYRSTGTSKAMRLFTDKTVNNVFDDTLLAEAEFDSFSSTGSVLDYTTVSGGAAGERYYGWVLQVEAGETPPQTISLTAFANAYSSGEPSVDTLVESESLAIASSSGDASIAVLLDNTVFATASSSGGPASTLAAVCASCQTVGKIRSSGNPSSAPTVITSADILGTASSGGVTTVRKFYFSIELLFAKATSVSFPSNTSPKAADPQNVFAAATTSGSLTQISPQWISVNCSAIASSSGTPSTSTFISSDILASAFSAGLADVEFNGLSAVQVLPSVGHSASVKTTVATCSISSLLASVRQSPSVGALRSPGRVFDIEEERRTYTAQAYPLD